MSSPEQDQIVVDAKPSRRRRFVKTSLRIGGAALAVGAVFGVVESAITTGNDQHQSDLQNDARTLARDDGYDRFVHDYATEVGQTTTHIGQGCLAGTGYDPNLQDRGAGGVVSADASGEIIVTAFGNAKTALVFKNPHGNTTHNLTPANTETYQTLVANGCSPGTAYGGLN